MKLPKLDTIIVTIFLFSIALWSISKCGNKRSEYLDRQAAGRGEEEERPVRRDTVQLPAPKPTTPAPQEAAPPAASAATTVNNTPSPTPTPTQVPGRTPDKTPALIPTTAKPATTTSSAPQGTKLYVTVDGLNMRSEPNLKATLVKKLKVDEEVYFSGKTTDWEQEINLGDETYTDRWIQVRTKEGKNGWVFGAGVNFYKGKKKPQSRN
jgi:uncharacterized protein YgiM (DUF1202 family)